MSFGRPDPGLQVWVLLALSALYLHQLSELTWNKEAKKNLILCFSGPQQLYE